MEYDFNGSTTPILFCVNGRVKLINKAARREFNKVRMGNIIDENLHEGLCDTKFGKCVGIKSDNGFFLIYCEFLNFANIVPINTTAEQKIAQSGDLILHASENNAGDTVSLSRLRAIILRRMALSFYDLDTLRVYRSFYFIKEFSRSAEKTFSGIGAHFIFTSDTRDKDAFINARNAAILLTQFISMLLLYSRTGAIKAHAYDLPGALGVTLSADLKTPLPYVRGEQDITKLFEYFPAYSVDLCCAQICINTCGYTFIYDSDGKGKIEMTVYFCTEPAPELLLDSSRDTSLAELSETLAFKNLEAMRALRSKR